jgi:hypothetical protein
MQLSKIMVAVAAVAAGSSAFAGPTGTNIAFSTGASATQGNLMTAATSALKSLCTGTYYVFGSGNQTTAVCGPAGMVEGNAVANSYGQLADASFTKFTGTQFKELRLNVAAGSFSAVRGANATFTDDTGADLTFRDPKLAALRTRALMITDFGGVASAPVYVGGLMDVQPVGFPSTVLAGFNAPTVVTNVGIQQAFGVAVSTPLYTEIFNSQKSAGAATWDKPIPSSCLVTDTGNPSCVPSISKAQMAAVMSATDTNAAYSNGANFLASTLPTGTELRYIRRPDTSGTQASAQNYFLGNPCSAINLDVVAESTANEEVDAVAPPAGFTATVDLKDVVIGAIRVLVAPGTGNVRQELSKSVIQDGSANYAIGVMSGENNQTTGNAFRWLRVQGAPMSENATPNSGQNNRNTVINGLYDFYFESVYVTPTTGTGVAANFWGPVGNTLKTLTATGLVNSAAQLYTKGGNSCQFSTSN